MEFLETSEHFISDNNCSMYVSKGLHTITHFFPFLFCSAGDALGGVTGLFGPAPVYGNLLFLSDGFKICNKFLIEKKKIRIR